MSDVTNILTVLLKDLESDNSLEGLIHAVHDFTSLINSNECLQVCINKLFEFKIQDQKHFESIATVVVKDVHQATLELEKKNRPFA